MNAFIEEYGKDAKVKQVPTIVYVREGKVVDIIERKEYTISNIAYNYFGKKCK